MPPFTAEAMAANQSLVDLIIKIARRKWATPAQVVLAWLLAQKPWNGVAADCFRAGMLSNDLSRYS